VSGALGGLCGALLAGCFRGTSLDIGNEYLLTSIAVVVIGGTSVTGGKANVTGVWGALLFPVMLLAQHLRSQRRRTAARDRPRHHRRDRRRRRAARHPMAIER
jgi:branched-subunit amino acid ABC-type transport system permease component